MNRFTRYASIRRRHIPGAMNRMEVAFAEQLELRKKAGEIRDYQFEAVKLRLAKATFYTCDFMAVGEHITFYEVKGFKEDDAMVKIKVAARLFPWFEFILVTRDRRGWKHTKIEPN